MHKSAMVRMSWFVENYIKGRGHVRVLSVLIQGKRYTGIMRKSTRFADYFGRRVVTTRYERDGRQMVETVTVQVDRAGIKQKLQNDGIIPREGRY